ncbi:YadA-like family protein [uncultured Cloacibacillus sp.]|uniref:YadA-like family protein n=1 Tax=uncultured Cloacibacillus sp. TaxID=889794 RepID=UPI00260F2A04|nr:YadA-like family protein [uncultured Cloacibacillus sp.]
MEGRRRKKKPLSRLAKTFLSYALIAALALPPQAAWADGQSLADGNAAGDDSLAVGEGAGAYAEGSIAIGRNAVAETDGEYALAVGYSAKASGKNSVAIGYNSVASEAYTVSVGGNGTTRRIVNVAESTADTDAATVGQLASLGSEVARIVGGQGLTYDGKSFTGAAVNIGGKDYETIEAALNALYAGTAGSTGGAVSGDEIVIDPSDDAVTIARGGNIQITRDAEDDNKFTIGVSPKPIFTTVYTDSVSMSSDGINMGDKKITGLAEGEITAGSTDAVTGGQLYTTNENIKTVSDSLGESVSKALGGTSAFADGKVTVGIEVGGTTYASVQEALNAVNTGGGTAAANAVQYDDDSKTSVTLNKSGDAVKLTNIADGKDDLDAVNKRQLDAVKGQVDVHKTTLEKHETTLNEHTVMIENHEEQFTTLQTVLGDTYSSPSFSSITVGNIYSDGTNINMGGGTITGLADGSIAPGSTDAVTGGQLWNAYKRMDDLNESINIVGAHAAALSGLHPIQYNPYEPTTLSAAVGTYRDEYAVAVGVFHYVRSNVLFNLGASICSDGDVMGRAGVSLAVGKGGRKKPELARDMVGMQQQMIAMQAMLEELKEENAKNKETIKKNEETIKELKEALGKKK